VGIITIILTWLILREKRKRRHIEAAAPPAFDSPKEAPFALAGSQPSGNSDPGQTEQQDGIVSTAPPGLRRTVASNNLNLVQSSGNAGAVLMPVSPTSPAGDPKYQDLRGIPGNCLFEMFELRVESEFGSGRRARNRDIKISSDHTTLILSHFTSSHCSPFISLGTYA